MTLNSSPLGIPGSVYDKLSPVFQRIIDRFLQHKAENVDLSVFPRSKLAAVLVLLFEQDGFIKVLLTTRSKTLRSHPGQTALPGGKFDEEDKDLITTAVSANDSKLVVIPVVAILSDTSILHTLKPYPGEVDHIFDHPLEAILDPSISSSLSLVPKGSEHWPYHTDYHDTTDTQWFNNSTYRMHRFRSSASPIKGLTSDILIWTAEIAFGRTTAYSRWAPGQPGTFAEIARVLSDCDERKDSSTTSSQIAG